MAIDYLALSTDELCALLPNGVAIARTMKGTWQVRVHDPQASTPNWKMFRNHYGNTLREAAINALESLQGGKNEE